MRDGAFTEIQKNVIPIYSHSIGRFCVARFPPSDFVLLLQSLVTTEVSRNSLLRHLNPEALRAPKDLNLNLQV